MTDFTMFHSAEDYLMLLSSYLFTSSRIYKRNCDTMVGGRSGLVTHWIGSQLFFWFMISLIFRINQQVYRRRCESRRSPKPKLH